MRALLRLAVVVAALVALVAVSGCGDDDDSEQAATEAGYVEQANTICRESLSEARRIGRRQNRNLDPGSAADVITQSFVEPGISLLERQAERLRRIDAPAEDEAFNTYVDLYDPAIVLVRERVRVASTGDLGKAQSLGVPMDQLVLDSREAARDAGLEDCDIDVAREIVLAAAGQ